MSEANSYGALNVRMRAQRADLLTAGTYNLFAGATDLKNLDQMLVNTQYKDIIGSEADKELPSATEIDRRLTQFFVDLYHNNRNFIPNTAKKFTDAYGQIYFLNNIKMLLSVFHGTKQLTDAQEMLISLREKENAEISELLQSKNIEDFINRLSNEDLRNELDANLGEYRFLDLIYPLIITIDQYYYKILLKEIKKLSANDFTPMKTLLGTRIGLQNIEIILRSMTLDVSPKIVSKWLITAGLNPISTDVTEKLLASRDMGESLRIIRDETKFKDLANKLLENIAQSRNPLFDYDNHAEQLLVHKANSLFRGSSFNIAIFPAFFILKDIELRNVRTLILGKIDKRSVNEILDKIIIV
ncbi:MAG: V-type ATPase subunit [Candidatus Heimdallarchaeota archaeon]